QHCIAKQAYTGHGVNLLQIKKTVAFGVVRFAPDNGVGKTMDQAGIHLTIPVNFSNDVSTFGDGVLITGHYGGAHAAVIGVPEYRHARILIVRQHIIAAAIRATVVYHINFLYFRAYALNNLKDMGAHVKRGDNYRNE